MLSINNLTYRIGTRTIIEDSTVNIVDGWKLGVVGSNGAGKTTLFKLISGELQPDIGSISIPEGRSFGQVNQNLPECDTPLIEMVINAHKELSSLLERAQTESDPFEIAGIYTRLEELGAYTASSRASILLTGLGFNSDQLEDPFSSLSGGWKMRVALAAALFLEPDILLLDEPTNHLDLEAIMWLENYLINYPHTLLMISHDREMLNKCVDHVLHVDRQQLTLYSGNYDTFENERAMKLGLQQKMHEKQVAQREHIQKYIDRFRYKASKARQAQSRIKALERMDIVDAVIADRAVKFKFPQPENIEGPLVAIQNADIGYVEGKAVLRKVYETMDMSDRIAILGANGNGKSTLIKLIAGKLEPQQGNIVRFGKLRIGYFSQNQTDELDVNSTPYQEMARMVFKKNGEAREPKVRAILGSFGFSKDLADNRIGDLSGGEKARLLFAFMSFDAPHLLLLDEPTNHLDIDAREALVGALNAYEGAVVLVSHDPSMVERVADRLLLVRDGKYEKFDGDLEDYRNLIIQTRRDNRKKEREKAKGVKNSGSTSPAKSTNPVVLRKQADEAERKLTRLNIEKAKFEDMMSDADFYSNPEQVKNVQQSYNQILKDIEAQEALWLELNG